MRTNQILKEIEKSDFKSVIFFRSVKEKDCLKDKKIWI